MNDIKKSIFPYVKYILKVVIGVGLAVFAAVYCNQNKGTDPSSIIWAIGMLFLAVVLLCIFETKQIVQYHNNTGIYKKQEK